MKKRNRRLLAVLCAVVTAAGIAAPAMTPVYAAQNEVTNEEAVNAEVMSAGNTKDDVDDSGKADEQEDVYSLKYITVDGRTTWYYANEKGEVDKSYTGVTDNDYGWWYVKNGEVDFSYTGLGFNDAGCWRIVNGAVDFACTGVVDSEYGWWYVCGGQVDYSYTGIAPNEYGWWRIVNGQVDFTCNSVECNEYGWFYLRNGQVDFSYTGLGFNDAGCWRIVNGAVDFGCTGVVDSEYGWWYVRNGQVDYSYTGIAPNEYGWWRIVNGQVDFNCNSIECNDAGWFCIRGGKVDFDFNGIASNSSGNWCIWGGKVNFGYDGGVKYLGSTYLVLDGEAFCIDEQIGKGSVGFLELINPTISGLFNCGYAYDQYTVIGAADDATSLENMRQALYGILECNELRKAHGLQELKISNSLMAIAEYDTNASAYAMDHIGVFNVGENLAWGPSFWDPFDGWYTQEKADFDQGNYANVGHYLNIIDDSYTITGFAVNQKSAYGNTYGQVFSGMEYEGDSFSVDDYCGFFMLYYNAVYNPVVLG